MKGFWTKACVPSEKGFELNSGNSRPERFSDELVAAEKRRYQVTQTQALSFRKGSRVSVLEPVDVKRPPQQLVRFR